MGGYGSGWHGGTNGRPAARATVGAARRLKLHSMRSLVADAERARDAGRTGRVVSGTTTWTNRDESTASVGFALVVGADETALVLDYAFTAESRHGMEPVQVRFPLATTTANGGGVRYWLRCPGLLGGSACGRRCASVYLPPGGRRFACRTCHGLTYESCRESHQFDSLYRSLAAQMNTDARTVRRALKRL